MTSATPSSEFCFKGGMRIKNRIVLAPMTNQQSPDDGVMSDTELNWLRMRAEGGFGMLITAASAVHDGARRFDGQIGSFAAKHIVGLRRFAHMCQEHDCLSILQLFHGGMRSPSVLNGGRRPVAPSELKLDFPNFEVPRALAESEIEQLIRDFASAARRAHEAGLSGVELHAGNGYLFVQFLSKATNLRTDRWGGSLENRARFLLVTVRAIRKAVPPHFMVGVRTLAEDFSPQRGFDIDEALQIIRWLNGWGIDYLHLASQDVRGRSWKYPSETETNLHRVKSALNPDVALIACGGVARFEDAEFAINEGADMVALAKTAIAVPDWPNAASQPDYVPHAFPMTKAELAKRGVSSPFVSYLRPFKLVADA